MLRLISYNELCTRYSHRLQIRAQDLAMLAEESYRVDTSDRGSFDVEAYDVQDVDMLEFDTALRRNEETDHRRGEPQETG